MPLQTSPSDALESLYERNTRYPDDYAVPLDELSLAEIAKRARADLADFAQLDEGSKTEAAQILMDNWSNRDYRMEFSRISPEAAQYVQQEITSFIHRNRG
jgi:hypothetical protein